MEGGDTAAFKYACAVSVCTLLLQLFHAEMLPSNVISFVRKMVTPSGDDEMRKSKMTKLKETFTMSTAKGERSLPQEPADISHLNPTEKLIMKRVFEKQQRFEEEQQRLREEAIRASTSRCDANRTTSPANQCRICKKILSSQDKFKVCGQCQQNICEDCGCYTSEDHPEGYVCTICRRKQSELTRGPVHSETPSPVEQMDAPSLEVTNVDDQPPYLLSIQNAPVENYPAKKKVDRSRVEDYQCRRTPSQDEISSFKDFRERRSSTARSDSRTLSRTSTQDDDPGLDWLPVPEIIQRRLSDTGPQRERIAIPDQPRRLSDTGPNRDGLLVPERDRRLSEFVSNWGRGGGDRRMSEAGAIWRERQTMEIIGRRMSVAGWDQRPTVPDSGWDQRTTVADSGWDQRPKVIEPGWDQRGSISKSAEREQRPAQVDPNWKQRFAPNKSEWDQRCPVEFGLRPPTRDAKDRRSSEGLVIPSRDTERRASDIGTSCHVENQPLLLRHTLSDSLHDSRDGSPPRGSSASESSGAEDEAGTERRRSRRKRRSRIQRQRTYDDEPVEQIQAPHPKPTRKHMDVHPSNRIQRHPSWERAGRRRSSGSSDLSDTGPDMPKVPSIPPRRDSQPRFAHPLNFRQRSLHKQPPAILVDEGGDYDAEQSAGTLESSPSPERPIRARLARRQSRGDPRQMLSDSEAMQDDRDPVIKDHFKPRRSWPEAVSTLDHPIELQHRNSLMDVIHTKVPPGGFVIPRQPPSGIPHELDSSDAYAEYENIRIVIDDVDSFGASAGRSSCIRKVVLKRDPDDCQRTRGLGMRVVGGKAEADGHLWAYVVWTMPGGPADNAGLANGDRILTWNGQSLLDRTFEEVTDIIDHSGDIVELTVEFGSNCSWPNKNPEGHPSDNQTTVGNDGLPTTRRKLPKTPPEICKGNMMGKIQLQIWYDKDKRDLVVTLTEARSLRPRGDGFNKSLPHAYARLRFLPFREKSSFKTTLAKPSCNPSWGMTFIFTSTTLAEIADCYLDISVWDYRPGQENVFLGETQVHLRSADLDDKPTWYKLHKHRVRRSYGGETPAITPKTEMDVKKENPPEVAQSRRSAMRKADFQHSRSLSDEKDEVASNSSLVKSSSVDWGLLHPEYGGTADRRKSSSSSEREHSEPTSKIQSLTADVPPTRMRSTSLKISRQDTLNGGTDHRRKFSQKWKKYSRSLSLKYEKRPSIQTGPASRSTSPPKDEPDFLVSPPVAPTGGKWQASSQEQSDEGSDDGNNNSKEEQNPSTESDGTSVPLGPGQVAPRGLYMTSRPDEQTCGEIRLGIVMSKGQLEVEVQAARDLRYEGGQPPDTYVKTYLKEGERKIQKKKTKVVLQSTFPQFRETLKYSGCDVLGRNIIVMVWQRHRGFESNQGIGAAQIQLDSLDLSRLTLAWYRLFPMNKHASDSDST